MNASAPRDSSAPLEVFVSGPENRVLMLRAGQTREIAQQSQDRNRLARLDQFYDPDTRYAAISRVLHPLR